MNATDVALSTRTVSIKYPGFRVLSASSSAVMYCLVSALESQWLAFVLEGDALLTCRDTCSRCREANMNVGARERP